MIHDLVLQKLLLSYLIFGTWACRLSKWLVQTLRSLYDQLHSGCTCRQHLGISNHSGDNVVHVSSGKMLGKIKVVMEITIEHLLRKI